MTVQDDLRASGDVAAAFVAELERQLGDDSLTMGEVRDSIADVLPDDQVRVVALTYASGESMDGVIALVARQHFAETLERAASDEILATSSGLALEVAARALGTFASMDVETNAASEIDLESLSAEFGESEVVVYPILNGEDVVAFLAITVDARPGGSGSSGRASASSAMAAGGAEHVTPQVLADVEMGVTAELGRCHMTVRELLSLTPGAIIDLDRSAGALVDVLVNGTLIARGEVVVIDEEFGIRISELLNDGA
jgi:flagellar motor switch protein FliN/FliY